MKFRDPRELSTKLVIYTFITIFLQLTAFKKSFSPNKLFCCRNFILNTYLYISLMVSITLLTTTLINYFIIKPKQDGKKSPLYNTLISPYTSIFIFIVLMGMLFLPIIYNPPINYGLTVWRHIWMYLFTFLFGITLSSIYIVYSAESIDNIMLITLLVTIGVTLLVYLKPSLIFILKLSNILIGGLFCLIALLIVNIFFRSTKLYHLISFAGIVIFTGLLLYDSKIIMMASELCVDYGQKLANKDLLTSEMLTKYRRVKDFRIMMQQLKSTSYTRPDYINYGLRVYLDIINLFIYMLRLMGESRFN
ncbi:Inhibitor of apoptosis-promoting Bax1 [seawater metagenome]|uniref:Inhibitor of apoptosis-promoting Bax1 n=1 Tax=seawater metagenome TaxID=1561972 RepID=A0A5E8CKR2_9ZZZZ